MKDLIDSYLYKISNLLGRNEAKFNEKTVDQESESDAHMSYSEYIKYIDEQERKVATPLQNSH